VLEAVHREHRHRFGPGSFAFELFENAVDMDVGGRLATDPELPGTDKYTRRVFAQIADS